jgi:hypothetical protein
MIKNKKINKHFLSWGEGNKEISKLLSPNLQPLKKIRPGTPGTVELTPESPNKVEKENAPPPIHLVSSGICFLTQQRQQKVLRVRVQQATNLAHHQTEEQYGALLYRQRERLEIVLFGITIYHQSNRMTAQ